MRPRVNPNTLLKPKDTYTDPSLARNQTVTVQDNERANETNTNPTQSTTPPPQGPPPEVLVQAGYDAQGNAGSFEAGFLEGLMGSGNSQSLREWGIGNEGYDELWDNPDLFLSEWGDSTGRATHLLDNRDVNAAQSQYALNAMTGRYSGDGLDYQNAYLQNMQAPGGSYYTMNDVMSLIQGQDMQLLDSALGSLDDDQQGGYLNGLIIGAMGNTMPPPLLNAYAAMLEEAELSWQKSRLRGDGRNYRQFLVDEGYTQTMGGQ